MTYALTDALQRAVFGALDQDATLSAMVGGCIHDAPPEGALPPIYVTLGEERVRARSDQSALAAEHDFAVIVVSDQPGFLQAKTAASRISDLLDEVDLAMSRGRLVRCQFRRAQARQRRERREIEIWFRAFVEDVA
ncbi:MAG: DUF3168 domain-containing protein [Pseudomonadota bacterium]